MVNFLCQLNWAMGCPAIWMNIILDVSVREFLAEANLTSPGGWAPSYSLEACREGKAEEEGVSPSACFPSWEGCYRLHSD